MTQSAPVLLVDSNPDGLDLYSTALALEGIGASTAGSFGEALTSISAHRPRVVVTGLRLPGSDGVSLVQRMRTVMAPSELFIVGLTTNEQSDSQRAVAAGCDLVLRVPCLPETLVDEVRRVLD